MPTVMRRYERARFTERKQKDGEHFENFLRDCYALIKMCAYADEEEMMLDKVVLGISHKPTRDRLELMANLTLSEAIKIARRQEMITNQEKEVSEIQKGPNSRNARPHSNNRGQGHNSRGRGNSHRGRGNSRGGHSNNRGGHSNKDQRCSRCGFTYHKYVTCPANGPECRVCKKIGHFESMCHQSKRHDEVSYSISGDYSDDDDLNGDYYVGTVTCNDQNDAWYVNLPICGAQVKFKIDTSADISVLTQSTYNSLAQKPLLKPSRASLLSPGGRIEVRGEFDTVAEYKRSEYMFKLVVIGGEMGTNLFVQKGCITNGAHSESQCCKTVKVKRDRANKNQSDKDSYERACNSSVSSHCKTHTISVDECCTC